MGFRSDLILLSLIRKGESCIYVANLNVLYNLDAEIFNIKRDSVVYL